MTLSVIIVNYNVKYFLEQCLLAVQKAMQNIDSEVFVVDNNSVDGSVKMVQEKFPKVKLISNSENVGFSKANNQAIEKSQGKYVLLLNPDTVVEDDTFSKVIAFVECHNDTGGLGVKMLDGKGRFLPESKRGLPTPEVAFYKIFGLSRLFPKSKKFGRYHLGFIDKDEISEVEILSGAFMLIRKEVLNKIGLLDEAFFMYGEDIDLSYRIIKAGYKNYYFPETRIIHYKGESTKKSSINYVFVFYNAMIIFAKKHFSQKNAKMFSMLINIAIYIRAFMAIANRFSKKIFLPLIDSIMIFGGIYAIKNYWELNVISANGAHYPSAFLQIAVPIYILIWLLTVYFSGGYDKPVKLVKVFRGILIGTIIILLIYSLLSEAYRFSRAIILIGALWSVIAMSFFRIILHLLNLKSFKLGSTKTKRISIIGEKDEAERVAGLIKQTNINPNFIGIVTVTDSISNNNTVIGNILQIKEIIQIFKIDEVIFCAKDVSAQKIIDNMTELQSLEVDFKIAPPESLYIIGSNSIDDSGDLYVVNVNAISKTENRRNKRLIDIILSLFLLAFIPVFIFIVKNFFGLLVNIILVLLSKKSWVGYVPENTIHKLPKIKSGILNPLDITKSKEISEEIAFKVNLLYARDYRISNDINIFFNSMKFLGRK
ncbi:MAG: glycosyltransferase [Bacteroidetes bacterium]|nr:glycosyltransferase [Bacteroidota bacterium]